MDRHDSTFGVQLFIYDLSRGMARQLSPIMLGKQLDGIWHTSIVIYGEEFFYGGAGISSCPPVKSQPFTTLSTQDRRITSKHSPKMYSVYFMLCCLWALYVYCHSFDAFNILAHWPCSITVLKRYIISRAAVCSTHCVWVFTGWDDARTSGHSGGAGKHWGDRGDLYGLSVLTWRNNI